MPFPEPPTGFLLGSHRVSTMKLTLLLQKSLIFLIWLVCLAAFIWLMNRIPISPAPPAHSRIQGSLTAGADDLFPYHYQSAVIREGKPAGIDVDLLTEAARRAGYRLVFQIDERFASDEPLEQAEIDLIPLVLKETGQPSSERLSEPYFFLRFVVFYWQTRGWKISGDLEKFRETALKYSLKVGVIQGFTYPAKLQALLAELEGKGQTLAADSEEENFINLAAGHVDFIFSDELAGTHLIRELRLHEAVFYRPLNMPLQPVHVRFRDGIPDDWIADFNRGLREMDADGTTARLVRADYYPAMFNLIAQNTLFREIELIAAVLAALAGLLLAYRHRFGLVGALVLAASTAVGGVLLRDLTAGKVPNDIVEDPETVLAIVILTLVGGLFFRWVRLHPESGWAKLVEELDLDSHPVMLVFDTLGMAAFTVLGVLVALEMQLEPLWLWGPVLAAITNGGGAVIRDLVLGKGVSPVLVSLVYVEHSIVWALGLSLFLTWYSQNVLLEAVWLHAALLATIGGVCLTRWAGVYFRLPPLRL